MQSETADFAPGAAT